MGYGGRKPKFDYKGEEFLSKVKEYALKGFTDKEIAISLGLAPQTFCDKKGKIKELYEVLSRARVTLNAAVRAKFLSLAMGGVKTKTVTTSKLKLTDGTLTNDEVLQTVEAELPPNLNAQSTWLFHHDEEWRQRTVSKVDVTTNGKDIVPPKVSIEIVYNQKEDIELQDKSKALEESSKGS